MIARSLSSLLLAASIGMAAAAAPIFVPNSSFESPTTVFAGPEIDFWVKTPQPFWWDAAYGPWDQVVGVFLNTPVGASDHIVNCDGAQAAFLAAPQGAGVFQDYDSDPAHSFNATFEAGKSYQMSLGIIGGLYGMLPGEMFRMSLYYKDTADTHIIVSSTNIVFQPELFPDKTNLIYFQLNVPTVFESDAWAGNKMGIELLVPTDSQPQMGYWDFDDLRLTSTPFKLQNPAYTNGQFRVTIQSGQGERVELLAAEDAGVPVAQWTSLGTVTNITGSDTFTNSVAGLGRRFYQARVVR